MTASIESVDRGVCQLPRTHAGELHVEFAGVTRVTASVRARACCRRRGRWRSTAAARAAAARARVYVVSASYATASRSTANRSPHQAQPGIARSRSGRSGSTACRAGCPGPRGAGASPSNTRGQHRILVLPARASSARAAVESARASRAVGRVRWHSAMAAARVMPAVAVVARDRRAPRGAPVRRPRRICIQTFGVPCVAMVEREPEKLPAPPDQTMTERATRR